MVAVAYLFGASVLVFLSGSLFSLLGLPQWSLSLVIGLAAVGLPLAIVLGWVFDASSDARSIVVAAAPGEFDPTKTEIGIRCVSNSLAVLPFVDASGEVGNEQLCEGFTEDLINLLERISTLDLATRNAVFAYRRQSADTRVAARRLQVNHILSGRLEKIGEKLTASVRLIDAVTTTELWSKDYKLAFDQIFSMVDDVCRHTLESLMIPEAAPRVTETTTRSAEAYESFLRGRGYSRDGGRDDRRLAIRQFQRAVQIDRGFVLAWLLLARECWLHNFFFDEDEEFMGIADAAGDAGARLEPDGVRGVSARAYADFANRRYAVAEKGFNKLIDIDPDRGRTYHCLARTQILQGKKRLGITNFEIATNLNVDDFESPLLASTIYDSLGDSENSRRMARIGVERAEGSIEGYPENVRAFNLGANGFVILHEHDRAMEWTERALEINSDDPSTQYNAACFFVKFELFDRALDCLENSVISRRWMENDADLDPIRDLPRFKAILAKLPA